MPGERRRQSRWNEGGERLRETGEIENILFSIHLPNELLWITNYTNVHPICIKHSCTWHHVCLRALEGWDARVQPKNMYSLSSAHDFPTHEFFITMKANVKQILRSSTPENISVWRRLMLGPLHQEAEADPPLLFCLSQQCTRRCEQHLALLTSVFPRVCYRSGYLGKCTDNVGLWRPAVARGEKNVRLCQKHIWGQK